jgi:hypothetical protein
VAEVLCVATLGGAHVVISEKVVITVVGGDDFYLGRRVVYNIFHRNTFAKWIDIKYQSNYIIFARKCQYDRG